MRLRQAPRLHILVADGVVRAESRRGAVVIWAGEASYKTIEDLTEIVALLAAAPSERCRRLSVVLDRPPAQTRTLTDLPPVRERELALLVANQAGRFFRRNGSTLVTDVTWVRSNGTRIAHAAAVEEPVVAAITAGAAQAGLVIDSITAADTSPLLQLLPSAERAARVRARRRMVVRLAAAALGVWLVAGVLFGVRMIRERGQITVELAAADAPLAALRDVRREMRVAESMVQDLAAAREARGQALATLARLSNALPDSSVVSSFTWRSDGSGVLAGAARRSADVLVAVERSRAVANPHVDGAIVREAVAGREWERFTIVFGNQSP